MIELDLQALFPPWKSGDGAEMFWPSNHALVFLMINPQLEVTSGPQPPVISLVYKTLITLEIPSVLEASKRKALETKTKYTFLIISHRF